MEERQTSLFQLEEIVIYLNLGHLAGVEYISSFVVVDCVYGWHHF